MTHEELFSILMLLNGKLYEDSHWDQVIFTKRCLFDNGVEGDLTVLIVEWYPYVSSKHYDLRIFEHDTLIPAGTFGPDQRQELVDQVRRQLGRLLAP